MQTSRTPASNRKRSWVVTIDRALAHGRVPRAQISSVLRLVGIGEGVRGLVRVVIVGDSQMRRLNRTFRRRDQSTDVLAFPFGDSFSIPGEMPLVGEVYCNYDHARRWQNENGGTMTAELTRLAVHGCLHLAGYDHHRPAERKQMTDAENRYLQAAGLLESRS